MRQRLRARRPAVSAGAPGALWGASRYCLIYFVSVLGVAQARGGGRWKGLGEGKGSLAGVGALGPRLGPVALAQ